MDELVERIQALHPTISKLLAISASPGLSLGVLHHGTVIHTAHFGRRHAHDDAPPNDDTIYCIGSLVKLLTAGVVASLVQAGKLAWDTPIREYLPEWRTRTDEIGEKTNLRDLLSNRTGIAVSHALFGQQAAEFILPRSETIRAATSRAAVAPFREQFIYSQWNYSLITDLVEAVTAKSFGAYAQEMFLARLHMHRTTFDDYPLREFGDNVSSAHAIRNDGTSKVILPPGVHDGTGFAASVGCKGSLNDLLRMYKSFLGTHTHQKQNGLDSTPGSPWTHTRTILEPHVKVGKSDIDRVAYCLGLYRVKLPGNLSVASLNQQLLGPAKIPVPEFGAANPGLDVYHHTAAVPGFHGSAFLIPSTESAVVVLTNSLPLIDPTDFAAQLVLSALLGEPPHEEELLGLAEIARPFQMLGYERLTAHLAKKMTGTPPSHPLSEYEGEYYNSLGNMAFVITESGEGLKWKIKGYPKTEYDLLPYDGDTFYWKADREDELCNKGMWPFLFPEAHKVYFKAAGDGEVDQLSWHHDPLGKPEVFRKATHRERPKL